MAHTASAATASTSTRHSWSRNRIRKPAYHNAYTGIVPCLPIATRARDTCAAGTILTLDSPLWGRCWHIAPERYRVMHINKKRSCADGTEKVLFPHYVDRDGSHAGRALCSCGAKSGFYTGTRHGCRSWGGVGGSSHGLGGYERRRPAGAAAQRVGAE